MKAPVSVDQFCAGFAVGDAISNEALILQKELRRLGFRSQIFSQHFHTTDAHLVEHYRRYHYARNSILIYHHSFHSDFLNDFESIPAEKALIHHNTTPPEFVAPYNPTIAEQLAITREKLHRLAGRFAANAADSQFNAHDLEELGFKNIEVMPVPIDFSQFPDCTDLDRHELFRRGPATLLFVGRIFPNKRHQDLIKTYYYYRKLIPDSQLVFVGAFHPGVRSYVSELASLAQELGLGDAVRFTDMISPAQVAACYRSASVFLSMSEHEGFFAPLVESMHFDLPVLAFRSSVIPETLDRSGIQFERKDFVRVAAVAAELHENRSLRGALLDGQQRRLRHFSRGRTLAAFHRILNQFGALPEDERLKAPSVAVAEIVHGS
ncbi:MAG: glycosyltransferase family 4 protein [Leptospirales bacterium]|nr:glycosyltransferase family 4 protein [Leptospirales bacterium]